MEHTTTTDRVLKYACTNSELSCIIGNLFTELTVPCGQCSDNNVVISGTTYTGEAATLIIVEEGFLFDGNPDTITKIRQGRCIYGSAKGQKRAIGIEYNNEG